jgi:hypothetical protein
MTVTYKKNGQTYTLHQGKTKKGNPKYFFALRDEGDLVEVIPPGCEVYENPNNAQVFLRRIQAQIITDEEVAVVEAGMRQYCSLEQFIVGVKKNAIVIYTPDQDVDSLVDLFGSFHSSQETRVADVLQEILDYSPMLQFILTDKTNRLFVTQRYSFLGSIDDWIFIGNKDVLPSLVKTYVRHLGKDSYYELH